MLIQSKKELILMFMCDHFCFLFWFFFVYLSNKYLLFCFGLVLGSMIQLTIWTTSGRGESLDAGPWKRTFIRTSSWYALWPLGKVQVQASSKPAQPMLTLSLGKSNYGQGSCKHQDRKVLSAPGIWVYKLFCVLFGMDRVTLFIDNSKRISLSRSIVCHNQSSVDI